MDKKIKLAVAYQGDLTKMNDDIASLKSIRRQLEGQEIKLRVRLDLSGIKSDAVKAAQAYHSELTKAMAAVKPGTGTGGGVGAMSAGGIAIPTGAMQSLREFGTASGAELKRIETQFTDSKAKIVKTFEQLERGLAQTTTIRTDKKGVAGKPIISQIDTTPVEKFKQKMEEIESKYGSRYGAANGGNGDVAAVLRQKKQEIDQALIDFSHLADSPAYLKTQASLRRLDQNLSQTTASQGVRATTASKRAATNSAQGTIHSDDRKLQADIKLNKGDLAAAKAIQDRIVREKELNRVLDEREALISRQQQRYTQMQGQAQAAGHGEAAGKFGQAAARMGNDLGQVQLDRKRGASSEGSKKSEQALERSLTQVMRYNQQQRASLALEEKQASLITNRAKREETINNILARRKALMEGTERNVADIHYEASRRGNTRITGKAEKDGGTLAKQSIQDMDRVAGATRKSTLANDFHSSSLVRNAVSFTRWTLAMTAVTAPLAAISSGISDAVKLERTFKTLNAVFQGSREEAAKLADQTLMLAAANGHDGQEAAEAVIAWSRLGLTRTQALLAVETSLRAANVAEISSAEATAYLTANYKAFGQTIADIPATLDYINALSNKNAVAPKQIFEGLSRTGVVAKQAGLSLQSLASIIATVSATTQRPGAEIGNSLKTVISRLQKPKTAKDLHSEIGYDITTATGEAKSMEVVLSDLAAIYPTLNTLEQGRLKNMVAGTNQGNRFAIVMETWGEKLLAEADAADAANSAMIENAAILDSVDSKLQKLGTTWDQAFHRMGESGLFDWMGSVLTDATNIVEAFSKMGEHSVAAKVYHAGETPTSGDTDSDSPKSTALPKFSYLEKILLSAGALGGRAYDKMNGINPTSRLVTREEAQNTADGLKGSWLESFGNSISDKLEGTGSSKLIKDKFSQEATDTANSQKSVSSATTMQDWFTFRSRTADTTPKDQMLSEFDHAITKLASFPVAGINAAQIRDNIRPSIEKGDKEAVKRELSATSTHIAAARDSAAAKSETDRLAWVKETTAEITLQKQKVGELNQAFAQTKDKDSQKKIQSDLNQTKDTVKELTDDLQTMNKVLETPKPDLMAGYTERFDQFIAQTKSAGDAYGKLMESFANTGFPMLDAKLKLGSSLMGENLLQNRYDATLKNNAALDGTDQKTIDHLNSTRRIGGVQDNSYAIDPEVENLKKGMSDRSMIAANMIGELNKVKLANADVPRDNDIFRDVAFRKEAIDDGSNSARVGSGRFAIGRNEGERIANQTRGTLGELQESISTPTPGNPLESANQYGQLSERLKSSKEGILSLEDRMNRALSERANLEYEITDQAKKQLEEKSKTLALASRDDQLRAASAQAFLKNNGKSGFSMQEFQYFSPETRGAIANLSPSSVKGLDNTERDNARARNKLDREIKLINGDLPSLRQKYADLRPQAEDKGGQLGGRGMTPDDSKSYLNNNEIKLQLSTGNVKIDFDMAPHIQSIVTLLGPKISAEVTAAFTKLKKDVSTGPNTAAAAGVQ